VLVKLKKDEAERVACRQTVLYRTKQPDVVEKRNNQHLSRIFSKATLDKDPKLHLAGIPYLVRSYEGKNFQRLEWEGEYFPTDLWKVSVQRMIPCDNVPGNVKLKLRHIFQAMDDVLYCCQKFHERKFVHRDVKSSNILLEYDQKDDVLKAHLTDFDLFQMFDIERNGLNDFYEFWSLFPQAALSYSDYFGAAVTLGVAVFGKLFLVISKSRSTHATSMGLEHPTVPSITKVYDQLKQELKVEIEKLLSAFKDKSECTEYSELEKLTEDTVAVNVGMTHRVLELSEKISNLDQKMKRAHFSFCQRVIQIWNSAKGEYIGILLDDILEMKHIKVLSAFIKEAKDYAGDDHPAVKKMEGINSILDEMPVLQEALTELTISHPDKEKDCRDLVADMKAYAAVKEMLFEIFKEDLALFRYLSSEEEGFRFRRDFDCEKLNKNKWLEMLNALHEKFPAHLQMRDRLQKIRNDWETHII
jgi:hypothetical protein